MLNTFFKKISLQTANVFGLKFLVTPFSVRLFCKVSDPLESAKMYPITP